ncbi:MAG: 30S ribosomal protein S16 [Patescibacteria group bacterium]
MLMIRLSKMGRKGERRFRVVVTEKRERRDGRVVEALGFWEKGTEKGLSSLNKQRYEYWVGKGARPSATVAKIFE